MCYLTLYVARFTALLTDIITVGTSVRTDQSTTTGLRKLTLIEIKPKYNI
jgi:hypothetical protein